jgi:uncharacterized Tic20 family protein
MQTVQAGQPYSSAPGSEERAWALLCHVLAFVGLAVPFGNIVAPLLVWMFKRDQMPFVREHGRESLNFQISYSVYASVIAAVSLCLFLLGALALGPQRRGDTPPLFLFAPFCLLIPLWLGQLVLMMIASLRAYQGRPWRYPLTFRLVKDPGR